MVKKWMLFLLILLLPLIIFYSGCPTPTESARPSIVGAWENAGYSVAGITFADVTLTFNADASYVSIYEAGGGSNIQTGTLSPATLPANTMITGTVVSSSGPFAPPPGTTWNFRYSDLTAVDVDIEMYADPVWYGPFTLQRQTTSIVGTWSCASAGPFTALVITIDADCTFAVAYEWGGSNTQTGMFYPFTMNAGDDLAAGVATSSGPNVPPPPALVTITIASPAVITWTAHGMAANDPVVFFTTEALPTGLFPGPIYYVVGGSITADTFQVSSTPGGPAVNTSGTQSGTHTGCSVWLMKYADLTATSVNASIDMTGTGTGYGAPFTLTRL